MSYFSEVIKPEMEAAQAEVENMLQSVQKSIDELEEELKQRSIGQHKYGFWTMKNGVKIAYKDMTETHIKNCIAMMKRNWDL